MEHELEDIAEWLEEVICYDNDYSAIYELIKDKYDCYEIYVQIHVINGDVITLRNYCEKSFLSQKNVSDKIYDIHDGIVELDISGEDEKVHHIRIPIGNIAWIDDWTEVVDWQAVKDKLKKENKI